MPFVGIFSTESGKVGTCPFRAPEEWTIINKFSALRVIAVTKYFGNQRANSLGVTVIASFTDVDITTFLLQGCIRGNRFDPVSFGIDPQEWKNHGYYCTNENCAGGQNQK